MVADGINLNAVEVEKQQCQYPFLLKTKVYSLRQWGENQYDILSHRSHLEHLLVSGGGSPKYQGLADRYY